MDRNRIDFEAHYYFPELMEYFSTREEYPMYDPETRTFRRSDDFTLKHPYRLAHLEESLDERVKIMDEHGIQMQVLSVSSGIDFLAPDESVVWCRKANDYIYEGMRRYPGRFQGFAALPVADVQASIQELERCMTELGFLGWLADSNFGAGHIDDDRYFPILETLARHGGALYIHPTQPIDERMKGLGPQLAAAPFGFGIDVSVDLMRMICKGVFDRLPDLKVIMTWLTWSKIRNSSGTAGSFLKSYSDLGGEKIYYKLSSYDAARGIVGHECMNELIVDRLLSLLGVAHLPYQLIHADILIDDRPYTTWLCASRDFKQRGESKLALNAYYQAERTDGETPLDFCIRNGWADYIWQMLVVDFLILNRDRHGADIEVLRNSRRKTLRLAPLFDHGLSLIFNCQDGSAVSAVDVMEDKPVECFVGSRSAWENLKLIPADRLPALHPLRESDRNDLFAGLEDVVAPAWLDKIWEMLLKRWCAYEDLCDQR